MSIMSGGEFKQLTPWHSPPPAELGGSACTCMKVVPVATFVQKIRWRSSSRFCSGLPLHRGAYRGLFSGCRQLLVILVLEKNTSHSLQFCTLLRLLPCCPFRNAMFYYGLEVASHPVRACRKSSKCRVSPRTASNSFMFQVLVLLRVCRSTGTDQRRLSLYSVPTARGGRCLLR